MEEKPNKADNAWGVIIFVLFLPLILLAAATKQYYLLLSPATLMGVLLVIRKRGWVIGDRLWRVNDNPWFFTGKDAVRKGWWMIALSLIIGIALHLFIIKTTYP